MSFHFHSGHFPINIKFSCIFIVMVLVDHTVEAKAKQIIGVSPAVEGQFPFYVHLFIPIKLDNMTGNLCGGSLLHPKWVLTAAHCFDRTIALTLKNISSYQFVSMGALRMIDPQAVLNSIEKIIIHPEYKNVSELEEQDELSENDIALIRLSKSYGLNKNVDVIMLPSGSRRKMPTRCRTGTIIGAGTAKSEFFPNFEDLHFASVTTVDKPPKDVEYVSSTFFYSQHLFQKGHPFTGDAGSAFVCYPAPHVAVLYGVISGIAINDKQRTVLIAYENINEHIDFIDKNVQYFKHYGDWVNKEVRMQSGTSFSYSYMTTAQVLVMLLNVWLK